MARTPVPSAIEEKGSPPLPRLGIRLTLKQAEPGQVLVEVGIGEFIAYSQNTGYTRLNLTGGKVLDVKETTDQIDRLVRSASGQRNLVAVGERAGTL